MSNQTTESQVERIDPQKEEEQLQRSVWLSSGSLALAALEAVCVFLVGASALTALMGGSAIVLAQGILVFHSAAIRLPILALATVAALLNLWLMRNQSRLRNAPAARWRKKPLNPKEHRRVLVVITTSLLTLLCVAAELFFHYKLHGSAFS